MPERFGLKPIDEKGAGKQLAVVRRLFRSADELIGATDAGREGELIFRYILELTGCAGKPARRLWLSSLTESAIRDAFRRLRPLSDYDALYAAARCRSEADWVVGLNATRYYTVRHRAGGLLWSVGRVQTPVLAMIVRRDDEIRAFKPEPFWELLTRYREVTFKFAGDRFVKEEDAQAVLRRVQGHPFDVLGVERKPERVQPPQLYDLTELQRDMNRRYGMSADATLKAAQSLYENKLISYPRTDSRYLGKDMKGQIPGILEDLRTIKPDEIGKLDLRRPDLHRADHQRRQGERSPRDHPDRQAAGRPCRRRPEGLRRRRHPPDRRLLSRLRQGGDDRRRSLERGAVPGQGRAGARAGLDRRSTPARRTTRRRTSRSCPSSAPARAARTSRFVRRGETTPPKAYTEGSLLGAMETAGKLVEDEQLKEVLKERGLGTPATRAAIIETLLDRGYITREKKTLLATDLGRYLVAIVQDRGLKSPELTGEWEAKLREVERGRLDPRRFMAEIVRYTGDVIRSAMRRRSTRGGSATARVAAAR